MNILITSGATRESIDKVRFITNMSSGRTGASLADELVAKNHQVTYLHGVGSALPKSKVEDIKFRDFEDLDQHLQALLKSKKFDAVIHLAAVSDYSVDKVVQDGTEQSTDGKIPSGTGLQVHLKPNFKILNRLKDYSFDHEPIVVGFKLTYTSDSASHENAVEKLFEEGNVDLVVHNDLKEIEEQKEHRFHVYNIFEKLGTFAGTHSLAGKIDDLLREVL